MTTKEAIDATEVKEAILLKLRTERMTNQEIRREFDLTSNQLYNYLRSLMNYGLIARESEEPLRYYTRSDRTYDSVRTHAKLSVPEKIRTAKAGKENRVLEPGPGITTISSDRYHTRGNPVKRSAWIGCSAAMLAA